MSFYRNKYDLLAYTLLFSVMGCFSYFIMVEYAGTPYNSSLMSFGAFTVVILVFNFFGHILFGLNEQIGVKALSFPADKINIVLYILFIGTFLFLLNYLMLACIKWIAGLPHPFVLLTHGARMLLIVWLIQLIMVGQIILNSFYRQLAGLYRKTSELEDSAAKAKYQALQNQLNPHFLFNNLNALISEIEYNPGNAVRFTHHLSDVYRYTLQSTDQQLITLRSELDFVNSYLFLHQVRLGDCIRINHQVAPHICDMKVPPLTLQLLVENVIKHNMISLTKPMTIDIFVDEPEAMLVVSNHIRAKKVLMSTGKGLENLSERYRLLCGKGINIKKNDQCFIVKVPLLYE